jgi:hypothetical protein
VTARVTLTPRGSESLAPLEGWALNVSRGGVRVILEEKVELGAEFDIDLSAESGLDVVRAGRVVWVQEEPDGAVVGIEFLGAPAERSPSTSATLAAPVRPPTPSEPPSE